MYIEHPHNSDKSRLKYKIDDFTARLLNLKFQGNFEIIELNKSWIDYEMQYSLILKQGMLERRIKGVLKIKDNVIIISFEAPETIKNFITEENLRKIIGRHIDNILE